MMCGVKPTVGSNPTATASRNGSQLSRAGAVSHAATTHHPYPHPMDVRYEADGPVALVTIDRPQTRNAIDGELAGLLAEAFEQFDADPALSVAVLFGDG